MEITVTATVTLTPGRNEVVTAADLPPVKGRITFVADVEQDLSRFDVEGRVAAVLAREVRRCAEIVAVGLKDAAVAAKLPRPDPQRPGGLTLIAGTKDERGRIEGKL